MPQDGNKLFFSAGLFMTVRQAILQKLAATRNGSADRVIGRALADSSGKEQHELAQLLLQRNNRVGWIALVRCFDRLSPELQDELLNRKKELFGPLNDALDDSEGPARANVIDIVRRCADSKQTFLLTEALSDSREEIRKAASNALLEAIRRYRAGRATAWKNPELAPEQIPDPQDLRKAVDFALRQYRTHKQPEIVLAALLFERQQDSPLWLALSDNHDESSRQAVALLRQYKTPELAEAVVLALGSPLKTAAVAGILFCDNVKGFAALAHESFRLVDPTLRQVASEIGHPGALTQVPEPPPWDNTDWQDWYRLIDTLELPPRAKLDWFIKMLETAPAGEAGVPRKLFVMRGLAKLQTTDAAQVIGELMSDSDERVARSATRWMTARKPANWKNQVAPMLMSPHASVRRLVSSVVTPGRFAHLWKEYEKLPPAVQVTSARNISADDADFEPQLKNKLTHGAPAEILQALRIVATLPNLAVYREQVIALCGHPDVKIAGTAVHMTGRLNDPRLRDLLEAAARHADPRVRANAIEAMEQLRIAGQSQQIAMMLNSRFNRERANAIKALSKFNFDQARDCLVRMLQDPNPMHRISAMWVVNELGIMEIFKQVSSIARRDSNPHVRSRAIEILQKLTDVANAPVQQPVSKVDKAPAHTN